MSDENVREFFDLNVTPNLNQNNNPDFIPKNIIPDRIVQTPEPLSAVDLEIENLKKENQRITITKGFF